jgi:hypothetical protein
MAKDFEKELKVMKMYSDNASLYIKLSTAALALTAVFPEKVMKLKPDAAVLDSWTIIVWAGFLVAIGAGAFYQYLAGKYMENLLPEGASFSFFNKLSEWCGLIYGVMLLSFYGSAVLFTCNAIAKVH